MASIWNTINTQRDYPHITADGIVGKPASPHRHNKQLQVFSCQVIKRHPQVQMLPNTMEVPTIGFQSFFADACAVFDVRNRGNTSASVIVEAFILIRFLAIFAHPISFKKFKRGRRADKPQEKKKNLEISMISRVWSEWGDSSAFSFRRNENRSGRQRTRCRRSSPPDCRDRNSSLP